jgi:hypothetical protein
MSETHYRIEFTHVNTSGAWHRLIGEPHWPSPEAAEAEIARISASETDKATLDSLKTRIVKVTEEVVRA